jgi:class 3 adenylate cyclase/TolB-like protein
MQSTGVDEGSPPAAPGQALIRQRCVIVVIDLVESTHWMSTREDAVIDLWRRFVRELRTATLPALGGRMVKSLGDGVLLTFPTVAAALPCALTAPAALAALGAPDAGGPPLRLRIGLHRADVVVDDADIYGQSVNLAARLASLARPDETIASIDVVEDLVPELDATIDDLGECYLKHWPEPVRAYRLSPPDAIAQPPAAATRAVPDPSPPQPIGRPRVAVLNPQADAGTPALLATLLADELATALAAQRSLELVSRMSTRRVGAALTGAPARAIDARYMVGGACHLVGGRLRVMLEMVHAKDQSVVWAQALDTTADALVHDPAAVLAGLSGDILEAIEAHETRRVRSLPLASLDAFELLLGGVRLMHRLSRHDFQRAYDSLDAVVGGGPRHPHGYAWLAKWHILAVHQGWSTDPGRSMGMAADMARRALDLDDACSLALTLAAMVKMFGDRDLGRAESMYAQALALHPNEPLAWLLKGMVHAFRGEGDAAVQHTTQATSLSPLDPMRYYFDSLNASAHAAAGRYAEAVALAERSLRANAQHASTLRILAIAQAMQDRMEPARDAVHRLMTLEPTFTVERFLARSPSADYAIGQQFAAALVRAGVPAA